MGSQRFSASSRDETARTINTGDQRLSASSRDSTTGVETQSSVVVKDVVRRKKSRGNTGRVINSVDQRLSASSRDEISEVETQSSIEITNIVPSNTEITDNVLSIEILSENEKQIRAVFAEENVIFINSNIYENVTVENAAFKKDFELLTERNCGCKGKNLSNFIGTLL